MISDWQLQFARTFWADKLQANPAVTDDQLKDFRKALSTEIEKRQISAVCCSGTPQITLKLALKGAGLPEDAMPPCHVDLVFAADGTVRVWEDGVWVTEKSPG
jgi:hypothetical protein